MDEHPNITLMRAVYEAFGAGDVQHAATYWKQDCVHHYPGRSHLAGSHKGLDETLAFAGRLFELTGGRLGMSIVDMGASDTRAYATVHTSYERAGRRLEMPFLNVMRIADGQIAEFWTYPDDQYAVDEFWAAG